MGKLQHLAVRGGTVRLRFTILYAVLFLLSGIGLLALTNLLAARKVTEPVPGQNPLAQQSSLAVARSASTNCKPSSRRCRRLSRVSS